MDRNFIILATLAAFALTSCSAGDDLEQLSKAAIDSTSIAFRMQQGGPVCEEEDSTQIQLDILISDFNEENMDTDL